MITLDNLSSAKLIRGQIPAQIGNGAGARDKVVDSASIRQGEILYNKNCVACHGSFSSDDGPWLSLAGYPSKWPDKEILFTFVRYPDSITAVNAYAKELIKKFGVKMGGSPNLSDHDIENIFSFIESEKTKN